MIRQPGRVEAEQDNPFLGSDIDRSRPIRFTLDGLPVFGFVGDTVLSAALASGIASAGRHAGQPLALSERFAPAIVPAVLAGDRQRALPMDRTPAVDGMAFVTLDGDTAPRLPPSLRRLTGGAGIGLGHRFDGAAMAPGPWIDYPPETTLKADLVIVGGGISGLSAALAAARAGSKVILIERRQSLGGVALLFGSVEGEASPEELIAQLRAAVAKFPGIRLLTRTEAYALTPGGVLAHQVEHRKGTVYGRNLAITAPRVVLATGASERLPVFPGNRLPGIVGLATAFDRAVRFGIWQGRTTLINTGTNAAYRLAILASKAGLSIPRITDTRPHPQSRFIEFSKAYGMTLAPGIKLRSVQRGKKQPRGLLVQLGLAIESPAPPPSPIRADQVIASGAWQPDLALWLMAGGDASWDESQGLIVASGDAERVALAGSAAGHQSNTACIQSGKAVVARFLGRQPVAIKEVRIDPIYETPDDLTSISVGADVPAPAYLDNGRSLFRVPGRYDANPVLRRLRGAAPPAAPLTALSIGEAAAAVSLGLVNEREAGALARERVLLPRDLLQTAQKAPAAGPDEADLLVPSWLEGRWGPQPTLWSIDVEEYRSVEVGTLIYADPGQSDPAQAIGVVVRGAPAGASGAIALIEAGRGVGDRPVLRDISRPVPISLARELPL